MSDIPVPSIRGKTDSERVAEVVSYLSSLSSAVDRALLSIDFTNLNEGLAERINQSITEHQDLSGYASKSYAKKNYTSFSFVNGVKTALEGEIGSINTVIGDWYYHFPWSNISAELYDVRNKVSALITKVSELEERIAALEKG